MCDTCREISRWQSGFLDKKGRPVFIRVFSAARASEILEPEQELTEVPKKKSEED